MGYRVRITGPAEADAYAAFEWICDAAPQTAERWLADLFEAIQSLAEMPHRCPRIPEGTTFDRPVRHLVYGRRTTAYRILFDIQEESADGPQVRVLRIWRGSRDAIRQEDLQGDAGP